MFKGRDRGRGRDQEKKEKMLEKLIKKWINLLFKVEDQDRDKGKKIIKKKDSFKNWFKAYKAYQYLY